jgi:membrane protease YdiL (CAAX protease family)
MPPLARRLPYRQLLAIVLAQAFALVVQAWLAGVLASRGYDSLDAHYLAYLVVPPILLLLLAPVLTRHHDFMVGLFGRRALTLRLVLAAAALGVTMRALWWSQLIAGISFGLTVNDDPLAIAGPVISWACPPPGSFLIGVLTMALLVPLVEETVHRGMLQSAFVHKGPIFAVMISATIFTAFHPPTSYGFVFLMGLVLGAQFWLTGSLWATIITHATYNGLVQIDWRCLQGRWNPPADSLPQTLPGLVALAVLLITSLAALALLHCQKAGALCTPAPGD